MKLFPITYRTLYTAVITGCAVGAFAFAGCGGGGGTSSGVTGTFGTATSGASTGGPPAPPTQLTGTTGTTTGGPPPPPLGGTGAPSDNLVAYYPGDGSPVDVAGGNNGVAYGGVSYSPGIFNSAFTFDGQPATGIAIPDNPALALTGALSISAWIRPVAFPSQAAGMEVVLFRGDDRPGLDPYFLAVNSAGAVQFHIESESQAVNISEPISVGQWYLATGTLDNTGDMRLYLNGILVRETITDVRPLQFLIAADNAGVGIGHSPGLPKTIFSYAFDGSIDDVRLYQRALTQDEVLAMYNAGSAAANAGSTGTTSTGTTTGGSTIGTTTRGTITTGTTTGTTTATTTGSTTGTTTATTTGTTSATTTGSTTASTSTGSTGSSTTGTSSTGSTSSGSQSTSSSTGPPPAP